MAEHFPLPRWFAADKPAGQYSRRHPTDEANTAARERHRAKARPAARLRRAAERARRGAS